jgi:hypothetical protein
MSSVLHFLSVESFVNAFLFSFSRFSFGWPTSSVLNFAFIGPGRSKKRREKTKPKILLSFLRG